MPQVPPSDPLARFLAGGLAGAVSRTVTAPLERLRTMVIDFQPFSHIMITRCSACSPAPARSLHVLLLPFMLTRKLCNSILATALPM